jgi:hypothetical protein
MEQHFSLTKKSASASAEAFFSSQTNRENYTA